MPHRASAFSILRIFLSFDKAKFRKYTGFSQFHADWSFDSMQPVSSFLHLPPRSEPASSSMTEFHFTNSSMRILHKPSLCTHIFIFAGTIPESCSFPGQSESVFRPAAGAPSASATAAGTALSRFFISPDTAYRIRHCQQNHNSHNKASHYTLAIPLIFTPNPPPFL